MSIVVKFRDGAAVEYPDGAEVRVADHLRQIVNRDNVVIAELPVEEIESTQELADAPASA